MGPYRFSCQMLMCVGIFLTMLISSCEQSNEKIGENNKTNTDTDQITRGGVYHAPLLNNPATLDPAFVQDQYGTAVVQQLFDGLVRFDPYLMVLPALAKTWQVEENGKTYRFELHENARFHNGDPVTAEDVIFSLSRLLRIDPSPVTLPHLLKIKGANAYRDRQSDIIEGLQPVDERVVLVRLEEPHAPFLTALGMYQAKIVPKAEVIRLGDEFGRNPVGSGPFKFVSWEPDKQILLERFIDYFAETAYLEGVDYSIYPGVEIDQLLVDFRDGKLDEMLVLGNTRQELSTQEDLQWFHRPALSLMFYGIRADQPPLNNPELRKALSAAIDRKKLIAEVYKGQFEPAERVLPPGMPGISQATQDKVPDTAQQNNKNNLEKKSGTPLSIEIVSGSKSAFAQAELGYVSDVWNRLGIELKIKYITDWSAFETYINSEAVQIYRYAWFADMPDPDNFLSPLFASDSSANFMRFHSNQVDSLLLSARGESNPLKRTEIYREIEALIMEMTPVIPLIYPSVDRVYQSHVKGAQPSALGADYMPLHRVWLKHNTSTP